MAGTATDKPTEEEIRTHGGFGIAPEEEPPVEEDAEAWDSEDVENVPPELEAAEEQAAADESKDEGEPQFDDEILRMAEEAGLPRERAQQFGSVEDLERALEFWAQRQAEPQGYPRQAQPQYQPAPPAQIPPLQPTERDFKLAELKMEELKEAYDPALVGAIEQHSSFVEHANKRAAEIEAAIGVIANELGMYRQYFQRQQMNEENSEADRYFGGLSPEYEPEVGKGPIESLKGAPLRMRAAIMREARRIAMGYRADGTEPPPAKECLDRALHYMMRNKTSRLARDKIQQGLDKRRGQAMNKPPRRGTPVKRSVEAGLQFADDFAREHGVDVPAEYEDVF
jgi:hypothetical protein